MRIVASTIIIIATLLGLAFIVSYMDTVIGVIIYLTDTFRAASTSLGVDPDEVWPLLSGQIDAFIAGAGLLVAAILVTAVAVTYAHTRRR